MFRFKKMSSQAGENNSLIWCIFLVGTSDEKEMSVFVEHLIIYLQYRSIGNAYPFFLLANHAWPIKKMKLVKRSWAVIAVLCSNIWRKVLQGNQLFAWHWLKEISFWQYHRHGFYCCWRNQRCTLRAVHKNTQTLSWSLLCY